MIGDLGAADATALAAMVAAGEVTPDELLDAALAAVEARNGALNAVVLMQGGVARRAIAEGLPRGPFRGVPFLIKDLGIEAKDFPSHNGSRLLANTVYRRDSAIFERIRATGVVTFGRTTAPRAGSGGGDEAAVYGGPTRNPWNLGHTSGGSSGGAGAAWRRGSWPSRMARTGAGRCGSRLKLRAVRVQADAGAAAGRALCGRGLGGHGDRRVPDAVGARHGGDAGRLRGRGLGAPYWAPPLQRGHAAAIARPPRRLRVGIVDTPSPAAPSTPRWPRPCARRAGCWKAWACGGAGDGDGGDVPGMMRAWTDIVAIGTALGIRGALRGRPLTGDLVEGVGRGACAPCRDAAPTRYLEAVGQIHAFGRQMAALFDGGRISCCRPPWPSRRAGWAALPTRPRITWPTAPGRRGFSPIRRSAPCSTPAASRRPACAGLVARGCRSASTWPRPSGRMKS